MALIIVHLFLACAAHWEIREEGSAEEELEEIIVSF